MNKQVKEPFFGTRMVNFLLGVTILSLIIVNMVQNDGTDLLETIIFALAAIENFIGAIISLSEHKKIRGNIYAIVCALFLIVAIIMAVRYFV